MGQGHGSGAIDGGVVQLDVTGQLAGAGGRIGGWGQPLDHM